MNSTKTDSESQEKPPIPEKADYFGGCPWCAGTDGIVFQVDRDERYYEDWFVCNAHRTRWAIGNVISWHPELIPLEKVRADWNRVKDYVDVTTLALPEGSYVPEPGFVAVPLPSWIQAHARQTMVDHLQQKNVEDGLRHIRLAAELELISDLPDETPWTEACEILKQRLAERRS